MHCAELESRGKLLKMEQVSGSAPSPLCLLDPRETLFALQRPGEFARRVKLRVIQAVSACADPCSSPVLGDETVHRLMIEVFYPHH
jgi:hypothetical protein